MKILFIDTVHPSLRFLLEKSGHTCENGSSWSKEEVLHRIQGYDGIVIRSRFRIEREFLDKATSLRFIARAGAGMENIDVTYAESKGIRCLHSPVGNRDAVGEHALAMLLALYTNLLRADKEVRLGQWRREQNRGVELAGKTVGIVGFGNTGQAFARKLSGFDCQILAYDKYKQGFGSSSVQEAAMETLFNECDILSLHIPLTGETHHLVNDEFLGRFGKNITVINTSRGQCLNTDDLVKYMVSGKVTGACLDVLEYEDVSFESSMIPSGDTWHYLVQSDRVILSPHIAGWTVESNEKMARILFEKISAYAASSAQK